MKATPNRSGANTPANPSPEGTQVHQPVDGPTLQHPAVPALVHASEALSTATAMAQSLYILLDLLNQGTEDGFAVFCAAEACVDKFNSEAVSAVDLADQVLAELRAHAESQS